MSLDRATLSESHVSIPCIFHRIWLGKREMPREFVEYGETWLRFHPHWTMKLWTDDDLPQLFNQVQFDTYDNVGLKSDILRYEILHRYGGIYTDIDFECLKNLELLIQKCNCFVAEEKEELASNGIMGAVPEHPFITALIKHLPASCHEHESNVLDMTGPFYVNRCVWGRDDVTRFPPALFYPYYMTEKHRARESFPEAYAVHHWACSWA